MQMSPGCACCGATATGTLCVNTTGCTAGEDGIPVQVWQGSTLIASGTTIGIVSSLFLNSGGSGYRNGTGYSATFTGGGGSGAAATFDVSFNSVTNLQLTANGSHYGPSKPTVGFTAAGFGSGASAAVTVAGQVCFANLPTGSYTVKINIPGYNAYSQNVTVSANTTTNLSASLSQTSTAHCCDNLIVQNQLFLTLSNGNTLTLNYNSSSGLWGPACDTATSSNIYSSGTCPTSGTIPVGFIVGCLSGQIGVTQVMPPLRGCTGSTAGQWDLNPGGIALTCPGLGSCGGLPPSGDLGTTPCVTVSFPHTSNTINFSGSFPTSGTPTGQATSMPPVPIPGAFVLGQ